MQHDFEDKYWSDDGLQEEIVNEFCLFFVLLLVVVMFIHPVRVTRVNRLKLIARVIVFVPFYSLLHIFVFVLPCFALFLLILFVYLLFFWIQNSYSVHHMVLPSPIL